jgi:hypothetical protein
VSTSITPDAASGFGPHARAFLVSLFGLGGISMLVGLGVMWGTTQTEQNHLRAEVEKRATIEVVETRNTEVLRRLDAIERTLSDLAKEIRGSK